MFTLPSIWNLIVSTVVFFIAAWYVRRLLDELGIPHRTSRSMLVFAVASLLSWGAGAAADWILDPGQAPMAQLDPLRQPGAAADSIH